MSAAGAGGGSCGKGAPTAESCTWAGPSCGAMEATPAAAPPTAARAATLVAIDFTVFMVPPTVWMLSVCLVWLLIRISRWSRYEQGMWRQYERSVRQLYGGPETWRRDQFPAMASGKTESENGPDGRRNAATRSGRNGS